METRLAHQMALVAIVVVVARGVWSSQTASAAFETALLMAGVSWIAGYAIAHVLGLMAREHVAVLAGRTAEAADPEEISQDRISVGNTNN